MVHFRAASLGKGIDCGVQTDSDTIAVASMHQLVSLGYVGYV